MLLIIMVALFARTPYRLKLLCKVVLCVAIVFLVLILIYAHDGEPTGTLIISYNRQTDNVPRHLKKQAITSCSDNMFISRDGCLPCPNGTFSFSGWRKCEPLLNCSGIALEVQNRQRIQGGCTKQLWLAEWRGLKVSKVAYLKCKSAGVKTRCLRGMTRLEKLQSPFVTRLIGKCYENLEV